MTGAGRLEEGVFAQAAQMDLPPCSDMLRPDDVAVIEFGVNERGAVYYASPIYASRPGMPVIELARAVRGWAWRTEDIAKVPVFFRTATRVELRCSTAISRPGLNAMLSDDVARWFADKGLGTIQVSVPEDMAALPLAPLRAEIEKVGASGGNPILLIRLLIQLGCDPLVDYPSRQAALRRALDIARSEHAPPAVLAWLILATPPDDYRVLKTDEAALAMMHQAEGTGFRGRSAGSRGFGPVGQRLRAAPIRSGDRGRPWMRWRRTAGSLRTIRACRRIAAAVEHPGGGR